MAGAAHLHARVRRRPQQDELASPLQSTPGRMLDEVNALLVGQAGYHANQRHICGQQVGLSSKNLQRPVLVA